MPLRTGGSGFDHYLPHVATIDFETEGIGPRPHAYPPKPVGVAIRWPNGTEEYLAWGHPSGNNCTFEVARETLWSAWQYPCLFHNSAFDMEVAHKWFGFPAPKVWHDTYFLLFLCYPHAQTYSLKPTAAWLLSEPPTEQDDLRDWVLNNVSGSRKSNWGAFISRAPVSLVAPYAIGDVSRTYRIYELLWPHVRSRMQAPYHRERALMPVLVNASKRGIRLDRDACMSMYMDVGSAVVRADKHLHDSYGIINVDSDEELADQLEALNYVKRDAWPLTDTGRRSTSKVSFAQVLSAHPLLRDLLLYRNTAATLERTFLRPWLDHSAADGRLHCSWWQVKSDDGGARTGRIASSNPNLANVPARAHKVLPPPYFNKLPNLRTLLLPEPGEVWVSADYASQELRHAAHFESGPLMQAYNENPALDLHEYGRREAYARSGLALLADPKDGRTKTKTVNFATLYGAGIPTLADQLGCDKETARTLRETILDSMGNLRRLRDQATQRWRIGHKIKTWGGREIPCQPPFMHKGKLLTFEYKALNMLIQGSAADQTKEALCRGVGTLAGTLLSQLYDEINVSVPVEQLDEGIRELRRSMEDIPGFDVPFTTDVEVGPSWGECSPYVPERANAIAA
jgi:DNA polymerase I